MRYVRQYFGGIASQSFRTAPDGTRLFYCGDLRGRLYVVPDAETEERLLRKQRWLMGIIMCLILLLLPFVGRTPSALTFFGFLVGVVAVMLIAQYLLFRTERRSLTRAATVRLSRKDRIAAVAARYSTTTCVFYLAFSLLLLAASLFLNPPGMDPVVAWACVGLFGLMTVSMAYILVVKLSGRASARTRTEADRQ
jgi:hypothetical protein